MKLKTDWNGLELTATVTYEDGFHECNDINLLTPDGVDIFEMLNRKAEITVYDSLREEFGRRREG